MNRKIAYLLLALLATIARSQSIDPTDQKYWNSKFSDPNTRFNRQPSRLLVDVLHARKSGVALDLGMGEGRNAIYLAQQGWQVTGVDLSDVGVAQARKRAAELHVDLTAVVDTADHYDLGTSRWDLIALFYMHGWYHDSKPRSAVRLHDALKPGGVLVVEGYAGKENFVFRPNERLPAMANPALRRRQ